MEQGNGKILRRPGEEIVPVIVCLRDKPVRFLVHICTSEHVDAWLSRHLPSSHTCQMFLGVAGDESFGHAARVLSADSPGKVSGMENLTHIIFVCEITAHHGRSDWLHRE